MAKACCSSWSASELRFSDSRRNRLDIDVIHAHGSVASHHSAHPRIGLPSNCFALLRSMDASLPCCDGQLIKPQSPIQLSLQLRDVAQIIQCEWIGRIIEIGFQEQRFGLFVLLLLNGVHAFAIEALYRRHFAVFGNGDFQIIRP